jgi:hypothetical protein
MYRWTDLANRTADSGVPLRPKVLRRLVQYMRNFDKIESLSVSAYVSAIDRARQARPQEQPYVMDLGSNMGYYSLLGAALGARVTAVEMQPRCVEIIECHLRINRHLSTVGSANVLNRFVTNDGGATPVRVPPDRCDTMASPSATRGRLPSGKLRHQKEVAADARDASALHTVHPVHLGPHLLREHAARMRGAGFAATKVEHRRHGIARHRL